MNKTIIGTIAGVAGTAILGAAGTWMYKKKNQGTELETENQVAAAEEVEMEMETKIVAELQEEA